jgi:hypothetical protein
MRVKIFTAPDPSKLEEQINHWFANEAGTPLVEKTETVLTVLGGDGRSNPYIVITIWYQP